MYMYIYIYIYMHLRLHGCDITRIKYFTFNQASALVELPSSESNGAEENKSNNGLYMWGTLRESALYTYVHVYTYLYIYIYIHVRETKQISLPLVQRFSSERCYKGLLQRLPPQE